MQLDDVIAATSPDRQRMKEAMERSIRWLDRCIAAHKNPERQNLFCIIQGGLDLELRESCCKEMTKRDTPGIAIGGLSGGEAKDEYCKVCVPVSHPETALLQSNGMAQSRELHQLAPGQQATVRHGSRLP